MLGVFQNFKEETLKKIGYHLLLVILIVNFSFQIEEIFVVDFLDIV